MQRNIKISKLNMSEEFEVQGLWWLPGEEEDQLSGNLFAENGTYYLEILGSFSDPLPELVEYQCIHGVTVKGEKVTLINNIGTSISFDAPGIATEQFVVNRFIVGGHITAIEQMEFYSVNIVMNHITDWFNSRPFSIKTTSDKDHKSHLNDTITFSPPSIKNFYIKNLDAKLSNHYTHNTKGSLSSDISQIYTESFKITPDSEKDYSWYFKVIQNLTRLMTLLINEPIYMKKIVFYGDYETEAVYEKQNRKKYYLFYSQRDTNVKTNLPFFKMLFTYDELQSNFDKIVDNWFRKQSSLKNVYNLYFSDIYNREGDLEDRFLNATQSLEVHHRTMGHGKLFSDKEKDNYLKTINEAIEDLIPREVFKEVKNKLRYFNEYSLYNRLMDIYDSLGKDTQDFLFKSKSKAKSFMFKIVQTRNHLTHYGENAEGVYVNLQLYHATIILKAIAALLLFKELGIDEIKVIGAMRKNSDLSPQINNSKQELKLK